MARGNKDRAQQVRGKKGFLRAGYPYVLARVIIGAVIVFSATTKLIRPADFALIVQHYDIIPAPLVDYVASILPWVELFVGTFLLLGLYSRLAVPVAGAMLAFFIGLMGLALAQGKSIDCGCFVGVINDTVGPITLVRDFVLLALVFPAHLASTHRLSLDHWVQSKGASRVRSGIATLALTVVAVGFGLFAGSLGNNPAFKVSPALAVQPAPSPSSTAQPAARPSSTAQPSTATSPPWRLGPPTARVVITEFGDYQCPGCREMAPVLKQVVAEYRGEVALVFRHFPLSYHEFALPAAAAAEAAGEQGKFWEMHELMYADQQHLAPQDLRAKANYLKLDMRRFDEAVQSERVRKKIQADFEEGVRTGLKYTPWILVNNQVIQANSYQVIKTAIESALRK